jgi:branched-chain amino acid transport system substrate-binding protein
MSLSRRHLLGSAAALPAAASLVPGRARAQANTIRIGVLTDLAGPYQDIVGPIAAECARLAASESALAGRGVKIDVVVADHQNKPDVGSNIARQWFDRDGVDMIAEGGSSAVALAVSAVARDKNKVYINGSAATSDLTGPACNPNSIHWTYDTYMLAKSTGGAMVKAGGNSWFFITADYAFGHALARDVGNFVQQAGGRVLGGVRTPFPGTTDFSAFLLQAQSSGARVIGMANAGADTINCIKQAKEFGITATLAGLLVFISDVHALGLDVCQGLALTETFYWDHNDRTRAFSERLRQRVPGRRPGMGQAGTYSSVVHYLKGAADMGVAQFKADGAAAVAHMKKMPTDDDAFGPGTIRADGRKLHPAFLFQVKKPSESKGAWDYYKLLGTTPGDEAFRPMADGNCAMVKS